MGVLRLQAGCTAHTGNIRLTTSREITVLSEDDIFNKTHLDIQSLLNITSENYSPYINSIINDLEYVKDVSVKDNTPTRSLKTGHDFREIVNRARSLGQYR